MPKISLTRNLQTTVDPLGFQFQIGEILAILENYLNHEVSIHIVDQNNVNKRLPTMTKGDIVFDFTKSPGIATLQQWDGTKLVPLGFDTISGTIDLVERGDGSGTNPNLFLASDGNGGWELRIPEEPLEFLAAEAIPPFSLATAQGNIADSNNFAHYNKVIGMVDVAVPNGTIGYAKDDSEVTNLSWAWSPGSKLFLNGTTLSVTPPTTGFSQLIAVARTPQIIIMKMAQAVLL